MVHGGPLTEPAFFVLTSLGDAPRHGYGIAKEVVALSGGRVDLRVGTLYGVLDRLASEGLVEVDREELHGGRLRRYYRLTDRGAQALAREIARQQANARIAARRLRAWRPADAAGSS